MNPRIEQLINQATMIEDHYPEGCNGYPVPRVWFDKVKFAELIVKECANKQLALAANYQSSASVPGYGPVFPEFQDGTVNGLREGAELIQQHFGLDNKA